MIFVSGCDVYHLSTSIIPIAKREYYHVLERREKNMVIKSGQTPRHGMMVLEVVPMPMTAMTFDRLGP